MFPELAVMSPLSRIASVCIAPIVTAGLCVPLVPALLGHEVSWAFAFLVAVVLAVSVVRAPIGLAAVILVLPFCEVIASRFSAMPAGPEVADAVVMAFATGTWARWMWGRAGEPSRLAGPALILAAAVVSSTAVELQALQAITPSRHLPSELWQHVIRTYWTEPLQFSVVHHAMRWLAWLAAAVSAERLARTAMPPGMLLRIWLTAGVAGALLTTVRLLEIVLVRARGGEGVLDVVAQMRLSALQPDVNAAGSYFLLFLVPALVVGVRRRPDWLGVSALLPLGVAFMLARSRAAIAAGLAVACAVYAVPVERPVPWRRVVRRASVLVVVSAAALGASHFATTGTNVDPGTALQYRAEMAEVALTAARRYPVFGVGLGDYIRMTRRFITPELSLAYDTTPEGENAHNNLLQIAVELGTPAAVVFAWLVVPIAVLGFRVNPSRSGGQWSQAMSLGLAAFLVSALFGHPLLIPQVGATFFLVLGVASGMGPHIHPHVWRTRLVGGMAGFYMASLLWRL